MSAASTQTIIAISPYRPSLFSRFLASRFVAVTTILLVIILIWYIGAIFLNTNAQRLADERDNRTPTTLEFIESTWSQPKPRLPAPHQVAIEIWNTTGKIALASKGTPWERVVKTVTNRQSLFYHGWVTLSATLLGFAMGTILGIGLAILVVHVASLDKSLMPWIVSSQTVPILAVAPMLIVVMAAVGLTGLLPKAMISTYLSFFPVTVGMAKGLRSPEPIHLDLMRTYNASGFEVFRKLRWPASLPFLFVSMKVAIAASLVGAIVGELPTGAVAGLGARLLGGSYYGLTQQMWAALVTASLMAGILVGLVGLVERIATRRMGLAR
jgi:NitT/TauT family transport system permease protein